MQYLFSDFYLLLGAADKSCRSVGSAWRRMSELMGIPVNPSCLLYALEGLHAGGFAAVTPVDGVITADTAISLTESGRNAVVPQGEYLASGYIQRISPRERTLRIDLTR